MSLVYTSLFALVPVVAVTFSVLKAFGYHRELEPVLFEFLRPLGVRGYELTANIMQFVENAQTTLLGTVGFVFLLYTVISMIQKVEGSLNFTWHVERPRSLAKRLSRVPRRDADRTGRRRRGDGAAGASRGQRRGGEAVRASPLAIHESNRAHRALPA